MARILLVSATPFEINPALTHFQLIETKGDAQAVYQYRHHTVEVLISGVGMVNMAFMMGLVATQSYDYAINAGICGSFRNEWPLGTVVNVTEDRLPELGAEDDDRFLSIEDLGFGTSVYQAIPFNTATLQRLPTAKGMTVNTVHGNTQSIDHLRSRIQADVETMEGAAFVRACEYMKIPSLQLKAISNRVEKRDRAAWQIPLALETLNDTLIGILNELE